MDRGPALLAVFEPETRLAGGVWGDGNECPPRPVEKSVVFGEIYGGLGGHLGARQSRVLGCRVQHAANEPHIGIVFALGSYVHR